MGTLREDILAYEDIGREIVTVPEWQNKVEVRSMSAAEAAYFSVRLIEREGEVSWASLWPDIIIASCYVPGTNEKLFLPADREALAKKNANALRLLADVAKRLSGLDAQGVEESKKE
jgi:hypothetical protein